MEFVLRELVAAIVPRVGLGATLSHWPEIARDLCESKRKRQRQQPLLG